MLQCLPDIYSFIHSFILVHTLLLPSSPSQLGSNKRGLDPLAPVDHSCVEYDDLAKDFYDEAPEIFAMDDNEVRHLLSLSRIWGWVFGWRRRQEGGLGEGG